MSRVLSRYAVHSFLTNVLPYLLLVGVMIIFTVIVMRQSAGGGKMSRLLQGERAPEHTERRSHLTTLQAQTRKSRELEEIVDFLKNPGEYREDRRESS